MSTTVDQGYFVPRAARRRRRNVTITTIPGQVSENRYLDLERYFGRETMIRGVVFVASFGFDQVWPEESDTVSEDLTTLSIESLSDYVIEREYELFVETCRFIRQKCATTRDPEKKPQWLLVLANKADLYWDAIAQAGSYYEPGCDSPFDRLAQRLRRDLGRLQPFQYEALPMAVAPMPYQFVSNRGTIEIESQLEQNQTDAARQLLARSLERLNGI